MKKTIMKKFILSFLFVLILPTTAISITTYYVSADIMKNKISDSFLANLTFIATNIERELSQWEGLSKYIASNPVIRDVLETEYSDAKDFYLNTSKIDQQLNNYSINTNIIAYISSLVVFGENGHNLFYGYDVSTLDIEKIQNEGWSSQLQQSNDQLLWLGSHKSYAAYRLQNDNMIGLSRLIKGSSNDQNLGTMYLSFNPKYFSEILNDIKLQEGGRLYIVDNNDRVVFDSSLELTGQKYGKVKDIIRHSEKPFFIEENVQGEKIFYAYTPIKGFDWWVIETIPYDSLMESNRIILWNTIIVFIISFLLAAIVWYFVSRRIVRPIKRLTNTMKEVQEGNLNARADIEGEDEVGLMNRHFNFMIDKVQELFHSNQAEQEQKKRAEIKALQSQINPHFLYNTLNTIRWMAIIQKSKPIQEAIEVLGRLLKNKFKSNNQFHTLEEEIANLNDYIYIEKLRYNNKFDVEYNIESGVLDNHCIKFILQPIVENAIFHGIHPKENAGKIIVSILQHAEEVVIEVIDNGIGMKKEHINRVKQNISQNGGIGLGNVAERLKLTYGEHYGLTIESEMGSFTKIRIIFPINTAP